MEIYLAGGCFWGLQKYMDGIAGVLQTEVGYANGNTQAPSYEQVCRENTGHAEAVKIIYDEQKISLPFLLDLYFQVIDPSALNRQGGDVGRQYRTGIYYTAEADAPVAEQCLAALRKRHPKPVVVELEPLRNYWRAEEYHQKYLDKNPGGYCHISESSFQCAARAIIDVNRYSAPNAQELEKRLAPQAYEVTQNAATEKPFQNEFWNAFEQGIYVDITTGEPLFLSTDKFESGCGWPSFSKPIDPAVTREHTDRTHGMARTEVRSRVGNAHLGHVFQDGPPELGGLRYCINSASLRFVPLEEMDEQGYGYLLPYVKENM